MKRFTIIFDLCFYCCKDKKAAKEREREERIAEAELENVHSARNVEAEKLKEILAAKCLSIKEVCWNVQVQNIPIIPMLSQGRSMEILRERGGFQKLRSF